MRKIRWFMPLLIVAAFVVSACVPTSAPPTQGSADTAAGDEVVTITFWHHWGGNRVPLMEEQVKRFEEQNPNIKVEMTLQGCFKENLETGEFELKKTPWKATPRTIVGSTKLILRYHGGPPIHEGGEAVDKVVRAATGTEYLRLIGWDDMQWVHPLDTSVEPPAAGNPLLANDIPNLIVTPHSAWGSVEARQRIVAQIGDNIDAFTRGQPLRQV